ncbi:hypothetical protein ANN_05247 [Periplaneta americana]|uniref:Uncharacterized protein n=1 Tax=Periplaneta americana TaxID=6978 RepID=A0ABQ8TBG4_PERAM|nr:hypothetical protein ANN_05247 [Periplaneta americana]
MSCQASVRVLLLQENLAFFRRRSNVIWVRVKFHNHTEQPCYLLRQFQVDHPNFQMIGPKRALVIQRERMVYSITEFICVDRAEVKIRVTESTVPYNMFPDYIITEYFRRNVFNLVDKFRATECTERKKSCRKYDRARLQYGIRPTLRDALGNDFNCTSAVLRFLSNTGLDKLLPIFPYQLIIILRKCDGLKVTVFANFADLEGIKREFRSDD